MEQKFMGRYNVMILALMVLLPLKRRERNISWRAAAWD
jgi:hypothetical protein